jgi:membrane protein
MKLNHRTQQYRRVRFTKLIVNMWKNFFRNDLSGLAAQVGFWSLYSLFPFVIFLVAISSLLPIVTSHDTALQTLKRFVPPSVFDIITPTVKSLLIQPSGLIAAGTLLLALWAASRAVSSLIISLNRVYEVQETRPFWKTKVIALSLTVTVVVIYMLAFILLVIGPIVSDFILHHLGLSHTVHLTYRLIRLGVVSLAMILAFSLIYGFAPNNQKDRKPILPGAIFAMAGWFATSAGFSFYIKNLANLNRFYGTLGAVVALLTWLYLIGLMILLGGVLNSEIKQQMDG